MSETVAPSSTNASLPGGIQRSDDPVYRRWSLAIATAALLLGVAYVFVTPAGLPYDEPSHWSTVQFYADNGRLPVLGEPGVTYEAQMGPVAYAIGAAVVRATRSAGASPETSFRLVRLLGVLEFALTVLLVAALTSRLVSSAWAGLAAVAVFALNPMLLTMSASVQNDALALLFGVLALVLAVELLGERPTVGASILVGAVAGLGVLTKLTDWIVVLAISAWLLWLYGKGAVRSLSAILLSVVAICGWWFVRNGHLYGDPTAASAVERTGVSFDRYHLHGLSGGVHIVEQIVTYLWLPNEYVRNFISAPMIMKGLLLVITITVVVVGIGQRRELRKSYAFHLVLVCGLLSLAVWLVTYLGYQAVAPRVAYLALPLWVALAALALQRVPPRVAATIVITILVLLNVWTLRALSGVDAPLLIPFPS